MKQVTLLHISDLQFHTPKMLKEETLLDTMCIDISRIISKYPIDLIVAAGDIAFSGEEAEYEGAIKFFDKLLSVTEIPRDRLLVVPGNHDVSRQRGISPYLRRAIDSGDAITEVLSDKAIVRELLAKFDGYRQFLNSYLHIPFDEESFYNVRRIIINDLDIAVLGLNSALFSSWEDSDYGNLILGEFQVLSALKLSTLADVRIAICHHPLTWLKEFDRVLVQPLLLDNCDVLLHGQQHGELARVTQLLMTDAKALVLTSGQRQSSTGREMSYNVINLDFARGQGTVAFRKYDAVFKSWVPGVATSHSIPTDTYTFSINRSAVSKLNPTITDSESLEGNIPHNLPQPDYGSFVDREDEVSRIQTILRAYPHSQSPITTIAGIGGVGKTALALEVARRYLRDYAFLPPEERFEAIVWVSAKPTTLTADGIAPRLHVSRSLEDVYRTISFTLERGNISQTDPLIRDELLLHNLSRQRTLLIVDNLESVEDKRVLALLRELPIPTKAILTTRHRINLGNNIQLATMSRDAAFTLIHSESAHKDISPTNAQVQELYERTAGVPLAIVWSIAQMGYGYSVEAVLRRLSQSSGDIAQYCFEESIQTIFETDAYKMLKALALFSTPTSREALAYVTDLRDDLMRRDEALAMLERLSLVNRVGERFSMLTLTQAYVMERWMRELTQKGDDSELNSMRERMYAVLASQ